MDPRQYVVKAVAALKESADARVAAQAKKYFKPHEKIRVMGLSTPALRRLEKRLFADVAQAWSVEDAIACCELLLEKEFLECKGIGILMLSRYRNTFPKDLAEKAESWLIEGECANWASCDALCGRIVSPLLFDYPDLLSKLQGWTSSRCLWLRRAAAVSLVPLARKGIHLDEAFLAASALLNDCEDLIHKATGWLLREVGKADEPRLESFLLANGPRIARTALRYAIERMPPDRRAFLLRQTKVS